MTEVQNGVRAVRIVGCDAVGCIWRPSAFSASSCGYVGCDELVANDSLLASATGVGSGMLSHTLSGEEWVELGFNRLPELAQG